MSERYDPIFDKHILDLRDHSKKKKEIPNRLAKELEDAGMPLPKICSEIKHRLREEYENCEISDSWIEKNLFDSYKRPKKVTQKKTPQTTEISTPKLEEEKIIEVSTTGDNIVSPDPYPDAVGIEPNWTVEEELKLEQQVGDKPNQIEIEINTLREENTKLLEQNTNILKLYREAEERVNNLEKYINERKNQKIFVDEPKGKFQYPTFPLKKDDKLDFPQWVLVNRFYADKIAEWIRKFMADYPTNDYFLIQYLPYNGKDHGRCRVNITKPEYLGYPSKD